MDDLNMFHALADTVQQIEHGVRLSSQHDIASGTLVCFLDAKEIFHFGFGYKNGSNLRVLCWENNRRKSKTVPKGAFVIAFTEETTLKAFSANNFNAADFRFDWFDVNVRDNVRIELIAFKDKQERVDDLIERLAGLTIQQIDEVNKKIDELKGN